MLRENFREGQGNLERPSTNLKSVVEERLVEHVAIAAGSEPPPDLFSFEGFASSRMNKPDPFKDFDDAMITKLFEFHRQHLWSR